jgi:hypothetical protein
MGLVPVGLAGLREQDEGRGVRRLRRKGQVQQDEWIRVPLEADGKRVEDDPDDDYDCLANDVLGGTEEPGELLRGLPEAVDAERGTEVLVAA